MAKTTVAGPCRLGLRVEGEMWNAYLAPHDTMEGAVLIGSISMMLVGGDTPLHEKRKRQFQQLMIDCMNDMLERYLGKRPVKTVTAPAPTHEKAGNA